MQIDNLKLDLIIAQLGIPVKALCMDSGIDEAMMSKLRSGKHRPRLATLNKIAKALNVSVLEIIDPASFNRINARTLVSLNNEKLRN